MESHQGNVVFLGVQYYLMGNVPRPLMGCSLSPILFSVFINGLLKEVEQAGLGVGLSDGSTIGGMLFADDFVGVSNSEEELSMWCMPIVVNGG